MATAKERVISELKKYFKTDDWAKAKKRNPVFAETLEKADATDISFGEQPQFIIGRVYGNATASGISYFEDTKTQRTISMNFRTRKLLFTSLHNTASKKTCQEAVKRFDYNTDKYYNQTEDYRLAKAEGTRVCSRELSDLNFMMEEKECMLNRYGIEYTDSAFKCPLWPIEVNSAKTKGKTKKIEIGYWEEHNGKTVIDLNVKAPLTATTKLIIAGAIAGTVSLIGILLMLL